MIVVTQEEQRRERQNEIDIRAGGVQRPSSMMITPAFCVHLRSVFEGRCTVETGPKSMSTLETIPFQLYLGCTESFIRALSNQPFQATSALSARTLATVLWVPLILGQSLDTFKQFDGVPPTGLQVLRQERVLLTL